LNLSIINSSENRGASYASNIEAKAEKEIFSKKNINFVLLFIKSFSSILAVLPMDSTVEYKYH
jgi:hypothetical protein